MDKQIEESNRNFAVSHQILSIVKIDFQKKAIYVSLILLKLLKSKLLCYIFIKGFTELTLYSLVDDLTSLNLNCKQCSILF